MTSDPRAPGPQAHPPGGAPDALRQRIRDTESELAATRGRLQHYQSLLQDLPEIFERKFRERLQPIAERNRLLAEEGSVLRDQIARTLPPAPLPQETAALPAAAVVSAVSAPVAGGPAAVSSSPEAAPSRLPLAPPAAAVAGDAAAAVAGAAGPPAAGRFTAPIGLVALGFGACVGVIGAVALVQSGRNPGPDRTPAPAVRTTTLQPRAGLLLLSTTGPSWIQVRTLRGQTLFTGTLEGTRRFSIGSGLEVRSGRPDLVQYRNGLQPARGLGPIEAIQWHRLLPPS
ncbi:MAG: hypothetical protein VKI83_03135 [Synechococcaceae cyanobacterium]|nr:hypothetical protein [Synechococcaceae cyanobacterium]